MPLHPVLKRSLLFRGMTDEEIISCLRGLETKEAVYDKGAVILASGGTAQRMGLVFQGSATVEITDVWGNRTALSRVEPGQFFAETYAFLPDEPVPADVIANERTRILFLRVGAIREPRHANEAWMTKLVTNILAYTMQNNIALSGRVLHTAPKTIRARVEAYLNSVAVKKRSRTFEIPFDRQGLADYLNVDRSALSKELSRMQAEGLIETKKNRFVLNEAAEKTDRD